MTRKGQRTAGRRFRRGKGGNSASKTTTRCRFLGLVLGSIGTAIGLVSSVMVFFPRLAIESVGPPMRSNLIASPFEIANEGALPIAKVRFRCVIDTILLESGGKLLGPLYVLESNRLTADDVFPDKVAIDRLWPLDAETVRCSRHVDVEQPWTKGEMEIQARFAVWPLLWWERTRRFPFVAAYADGEPYWERRHVE